MVFNCFWHLAISRNNKKSFLRPEKKCKPVFYEDWSIRNVTASDVENMQCFKVSLFLCDELVSQTKPYANNVLLEQWMLYMLDKKLSRKEQNNLFIQVIIMKMICRGFALYALGIISPFAGVYSFLIRLISTFYALEIIYKLYVYRKSDQILTASYLSRIG